MTEQTAIVKASGLDELQRTASLLVASGYFDAKGDRNTQIAQLAVKIMAGQELGFTPFASAQGIHIIQGKPQISANLMAAAVKAHPRYDYKVVKMADDGVVLRFFENGAAVGDSTFTAEDARKAGTQNMTKFPRNMMFARAMSNGVRWFCPDVFHGQSVYVEGELMDGAEPEPAVIVVDAATGEVIEPGASEPAPELAANTLTETQRRHLHAVGTQAYGADWDAKRHAMVRTVTRGRTESSNDLTPEEAAQLIAGIEKKLNTTGADAGGR